MTREAEYVASQIDRKLQSMNKIIHGMSSESESESHFPLVLQVTVLVKLQRCILEDIENDKSHHGENFDVGAFLSSLNIEAKNNRSHNPQANVGWLRKFLETCSKEVEAQAA
jgi:hypothetical protein